MTTAETPKRVTARDLVIPDKGDPFYATFRSKLGLGWGRAGPVLCGIRHQARWLGLDLEPFPFVQMHELVKTYDIVVTGATGAVMAFADFMQERGYV